MAQVVLFELDHQLYGLDIASVVSIEKLNSITRLPGTAEFIRGLTNLRGVIVPVIDGRRFFGLQAFTNEQTARTMIIERDGVRVGLMVDGTKNVIDIDETTIQVVPEEMLEGGRVKLTGVVYIDSEAIGLIDERPMLDAKDAVL